MSIFSQKFGDELDDAALEELATGPLVKRLQMSENSPEGLNHCTREMFALAMLVRLGRVSENDVRSTFAAFKKLDRDNDGLLTSKEVIMSTMERRKKEQGLGRPSRPFPDDAKQIERPQGFESRSRGNSIESNYSALTYEDGDADHFANLNWAAQHQV